MMSATANPAHIVNFFTAMQAGRAGAQTMETLFAENATYSEPFGGSVNTHTGRKEILAAMARGWDYPLPDIHIKIEQIATTGNEVVVKWTCYSSGLPGGKGSGQNRFRLSADGKIAELETTLD